MQRYFIDKNNFDLINNKVSITCNDYHHMKNVMRFKIFDEVIACFDNFQYLCRITSIEKTIILDIVEDITISNELNSYICIAHGLIKKDKQSEVIRRLVELGCSSYLNVSMERSLLKINNIENILNRNQTIIKEASEQSERTKLMELLETRNFNQFLEFSKSFDLKIVCYEKNRNNLASLKKSLINFSNKKVLALVGPEGGISDNEILKLEKAGFISVGLGKRILRTETAPLFLMSIISFLLEHENE